MIPVIIPAYKNPEQLAKCIEHLSVQKNASPEIFVRDNSEDNILFTAAVNEGIKSFLERQAWRYILIINQDFYLRPDALIEMIKFMDNHPKCGIGMPIQLQSGEEGQENDRASFAGGTQAFPKGVCLAGSVQLYWANAEITWASGGCLIFRRKMIEEIGLLDENLRFVGSDSDYSFTARSRGWQVWRISKARGLHDCGMSNTPDCGHELNLIKVEDMLYFSKKWLTGGLYRELASDGEDTSQERVDIEIASLLDMKKRIKKEMEN